MVFLLNDDVQLCNDILRLSVFVIICNSTLFIHTYIHKRNTKGIYNMCVHTCKVNDFVMTRGHAARYHSHNNRPETHVIDGHAAGWHSAHLISYKKFFFHIYADDRMKYVRLVIWFVHLMRFTSRVSRILGYL